MQATRLKGTITADHLLMIKLPKNLPAGEVEVILLKQKKTAASPKKLLKPMQCHPAFGMWAQRSDIADSADYAATLRRSIERRSDASK